MKKYENEIMTFVDMLRDNPVKSGRLIKDLVKKTNRLYLNFPIIGPARRISSELKKGPFSYFYIFERTLAHKLHPLLYKYGFNFISNSIINSLYEQKLEFYKPLIPLKAGRVPGTTAGLKLKNLVMMKELITRMVFKDGHFMVIMYFDNNFSKLDRGLSSILRGIELSMHNMKRGLTENKKSNGDMIMKRFKLFRENHGKENGPLFIERMKWDEELKEYADMLNEEKEDKDFQGYDSDLRTINLDSDETSSNEEDIRENEPSGEEKAETGEEEKTINRITGYADKIKEKYLDAISDEDADAVKKILETIYSTNREKSGEAKAEEIVTDIVKIWLDDELISNGKKDFLRSVHTKMFGKDERERKNESTIDERLDAISDFIDNLEEDERDTESENTLLSEDAELGEFPVTEPDETVKPGEFPISEPEKVVEQEGLLFEEKVDFDDYIEEGEKKLLDIEERLDKRTREWEEEAGEIFNSSDEEKKSAFAIKMLGSESGSQSLFKILPDTESSSGENLFIRIVRKLEEGPFRYMTPSEKVALIDRLIDVFNMDNKILSQLENYKKLIERPSELLESVTNNLERIEQENPNAGTVVEKQLIYLDNVFENEEYEPIWFTVKSLYRNIIKQKKSNVIDDVMNDLNGQSQWKKAVVLKFLDRFYQGDSKKLEELGKRLASRELQALSGRIENERNGKSGDIDDIFRKLTGESAGISEWVEKVISKADEKGADISVVTEVLKEFLKRGDFSDEETAERLAGEVDQIIRLNAEKALLFLDTLLNAIDISDDAKRIILKKMKDSERSGYLDLHDFHRIMENAVLPEEKKNLVNMYKEILGKNLPPDKVREVLSGKITFLKHETGKMKSESRARDILAGGNDENMRSLLEVVAADSQVSGEISRTAKKIGEAFDADKLDEAFSAITCSTNSPETKIKLLETLVKMVKRKLSSVGGADAELQSGIIKIENKIGFYGNILGESAGEKKKYKKRMGEIIREYPVKLEKKTSGDSLHEEKEMTFEEKIYNRTLSLVKSFSDNIDALGSIIDVLVGFNSGDFQSKLINEYRSGLKQREMLVSRAVNVIKTGKPDSELVELLHRSPPKFQYDWGEGVKKKLGAASLDEAMKSLEKNRDLYSELNRIAKIIKSNNKNDFLKKAIEKEKKLVDDIAGDISVEGLRKLKFRTVSSRDKEKINLFRDLVKIAGITADSQKSEYRAVSRKSVAENNISKISESEISEQKTTVGKEREKKPEGQEMTNGPAIKDIIIEMNNFINLCKSERTRSMAVKSSKRLMTIDSFFKHLASGDNTYAEAAKKNIDELKEVFKGIIKHRFNKEFPTAGPALKYCFDNGLIKRSDLT